jgi:aspartate/methionine/tyrosine aminotransferase
VSGSARLSEAVRRLQGNQALQLEMPGPLASGRDLSGDHPIFELAPVARRAVSEALEAGETHYADVPGIAPLRRAVAAALAAQGLRVDAEEGLIIASGEQEARFLALHALAHMGYRVVLPSIVHPGASKAASLGQMIADRLALDPVTMAPAIGNVTRALATGKTALYLESPNRLTGKIIDRSTIEAVAEAVTRADAVVVWDATLAPWVPDGTPHGLIGALPGMAERTITLGTLWSGAGVEGWLAAYLAGPPALFQRALSLKQIIAICTTTPAQWGVLGVLQAGPAALNHQRVLLQQIKIEAAGLLPSRVLPGEAAAVLAVRPAAGVDLSELPARPMPGEAFGAPGVLRFTVTPTGEVVGAMRALAASETRHGDSP